MSPMPNRRSTSNPSAPAGSPSPHADAVSGESPRVVAHRGASAQRPEHTRGAYELALDQGSDGLECDVRLTRDGQLVCVHDRRVDRTSNGTGVVSEMTLAQLNELDFSSWHDGGAGDEPGVLCLTELVELAFDWGQPVTLFIETKHPVRYGALVERRLLELLDGYGLVEPRHAARVHAVMMSFSTAAVWRVRRSAPMLPTVQLGEAARFLGAGSAEASGAANAGPPGVRSVGPSIGTLRERPQLVERAVAAGRGVYCWTVDEFADVTFCRDVGVNWVATNHPGRTRKWLGG